MNTKALIAEIEARLDPDHTGIDYRDGFNDAIEVAAEIINKHMEGMVIVPVEPTEEMQWAAISTQISTTGDMTVHLLKVAETYYEAMITAYNQGEE